jgi:hypothetical protein
MPTTFLYAFILHALQTLLVGGVKPGADPGDEAAERSARLETTAGPVRVWAPADYDPATAATVVYVHGYKRTADSVWTTGALPDQFRASGENALFIVPTVADSDRAPLRWSSLEALLAEVERAGFTRPAGPVVAIGHSGAYRTLSRWVDTPALTALVLLDALYGQDEAFARFARRGRLLMVSHCTAARARRFLTRFTHVPRRDALPDRPEFTVDERAANVVAFDTTLSHTALNDSGASIPTLLPLALTPPMGPMLPDGVLARID